MADFVDRIHNRDDMRLQRQDEISIDPQMRRLFKTWDTDQSGALNREEISQMVSGMAFDQVPLQSPPTQVGEGTWEITSWELPYNGFSFWVA